MADATNVGVTSTNGDEERQFYERKHDTAQESEARLGCHQRSTRRSCRPRIYEFNSRAHTSCNQDFEDDISQWENEIQGLISKAQGCYNICPASLPNIYICGRYRPERDLSKLVPTSDGKLVEPSGLAIR